MAASKSGMEEAAILIFSNACSVRLSDANCAPQSIGINAVVAIIKAQINHDLLAFFDISMERSFNNLPAQPGQANLPATYGWMAGTRGRSR